MEFFQKDGNDYYIHTGFARFVESLSHHFDRIDVCVPVVPAGFFPFDGKKFTVKNTRIVELPNLFGLWNCHKNAISAIKILSRNLERWDLVSIRIPEPFDVFAYCAVAFHRKPIFIHVVADGDVLRHSRIRRCNVITRFAGAVYSAIMGFLERIMISRSLTIVNGSALYSKYHKPAGELYEIITSSYWDGEISRTSARRYYAPYRILYVGRFAEEKGIFDLLHVVKILHVQGYDTILRLVGYPGEPNIEKDLKNSIDMLQITDRVEFAGYREIGKSLWEEYRDCHVFVLPSYSEGTPRVLLEAMSQGIPVIATNTGSVTDVITNGINGLVVQTGAPQQLAKAITKILDDHNLRNRLVGAGLETARARSLAKSTRSLINILINSRKFAGFRLDSNLHVLSPR